ncbi:MAG: cyclase family protein, partial [Candidatus Marsarchaeota archaeon]|nr:cyclase family protein [Candidatus Marsarchaeota archaeon]
MHVYDISMEVKEGMLTYPGNPAVKIRSRLKIPKSVNNVSEISMGSHTGTHVDSELHIKNDGKGADMLPLNGFYGPARVLDVTKAGSSIGRKELSRFGVRRGEIILIKSSNSTKQYKRFRKDYAHISVDGARYLTERRVKTLGVDYLSVKRFGGD